MDPSLSTPHIDPPLHIERLVVETIPHPPIATL